MLVPSGTSIAACGAGPRRRRAWASGAPGGGPAGRPGSRPAGTARGERAV